jgi:hypothetical protein
MSATKSQLVPGQLYSGEIQKGLVFFVAHAAQIVLLCTAGLLAMVTTDMRNIQRGYLVPLGALFAAAGMMMLRGYPLADLLSTRIVDSTGPFPFFLTVFAFVGARRRNWEVLGKVIVVLCAVLSLLAVMAAATLNTLARAEAVISLAGILNGLYWPAAVMALTNYPDGSWLRRLRFAPMAVYAVVSFFTQTRLNYVMVFALMLVYAYLQRKRRAQQALTWIAGILLCIWIVLFTAVFLSDTRVMSTIDSVADAFSARLEEDTRSGQWEWFTRTVAPQELILGRGSLATWNWGGAEWRGGTDFGYLTLLLFGGLPLLLTYVVAVMKPGWNVLKANPDEIQIVGAGILCLWSIRMLSSSYPGMSIEYHVILLCLGACLSREGVREPSRPALQSKVERVGVYARPLVYK